MLEKKLRVSPEILFDTGKLTEEICNVFGIRQEDLAFKILRRSVDARRRPVKYELLVCAWNKKKEAFKEPGFNPGYREVGGASKICHIIGAGPAGYFAALECLKAGIKPVILERGKDVRSRRRDLADIFKKRTVHPHSNYCFGEGGAGTYSDGKLYTRSHKRGDIYKILQTLVYHGANEDILVDTHPHIGTNRLPGIIENIRQTILQYGGEVHFNTFLKNIELKGDFITNLVVTDEKGYEQKIPCQKVILATGHSGREVYEMLQRKKIEIEIKPFALGVRVEHPQELIDCIQYHCSSTEREMVRKYLPAASYALKSHYQGRGIYSFCMCPGGIIAPCATGPEEVVTNGWSPSKRNNPFANSGMVVEIKQDDILPFKKFGPLAALEFQKSVEHRAWQAGGKNLSAPAVRLTDFLKNKISSDLPPSSYKPGIVPADLMEVLGKKIGTALREGLKSIGKKVKGYVTEDAVLVGVESRTSSPVRIPRDPWKGHHPQIKNLYPCGEGAGYAGGIMSAAMDGVRIVGFLVEG
ncbi:MAG: FAD-binding protein [Bacteroidia bacterium]|nr:FAD-binding protein [Bacteroidia bacterium]